MFDWNRIPKNKRHLRKVQLGAGTTNAKDYINLDCFQDQCIDLMHNITEPLPFDDDSIEEFYSHHVIEHVNYPDAQKLFREVFRCLKTDGRFVSRLPDIQNVARQLATLPLGEHRDNMLICMYGGNAFGWQPADAHKHFFGWSTAHIKDELEKVGFYVEKCVSVEPNSTIPVIDFVAIKKDNAGVVMEPFGERCIELPWLFENIKPGSTLDVGCAESSYTFELMERGCMPYVGNDVRPFGSIAPATSLIGDIRSFSPQDIGTFDNVIVLSTLEHIALEAYAQQREVSKQDSAYYKQMEALAHMYSLVKPGGQLLLTVPYGKYEDGGWFIIYDQGMISEIRNAYPVLKEQYFTLVNRKNNTYIEVTKANCPAKGIDHYMGNMRATSCACLVIGK